MRNDAPPPPYDPTGVVSVPTSVHRRGHNGPTCPCRNHLFDLLATIAPEHRHRAFWRMPRTAWEAIKADPALRTDWRDNHPRMDRFGPTSGPTLLGVPVVVGRGDHHHPVEIVVSITC
jgi:hypothetical protein